MAMSVLAPNQISKKGQLDNNVWLAGCVARTRDRAPTGASLDKGKEKGKGNGKGKSKKFSSRNVAADQPRSGFEVYLNGGSAPNDVMMVEAWVPEAVQKLKAAVGDAEGGVCYSRHQRHHQGAQRKDQPMDHVTASSVFDAR